MNNSGFGYYCLVGAIVFVVCTAHSTLICVLHDVNCLLCGNFGVTTRGASRYRDADRVCLSMQCPINSTRISAAETVEVKWSSHMYGRKIRQQDVLLENLTDELRCLVY